MKRITLYGTKKCPWTDNVRILLEEKGSKFKFIDVLDDEKAKLDLVKKTKQYSIPVVEIDDTVIIGFDRNKIEELLR